MKHAILPAVVVLVLISCTTIRVGSYRLADPDVVYDTDFSSDDGLLKNEDRKVYDIRDGIFTMSGHTGVAFAQEYGYNSVTSLRIKFGEPIEQNWFGNINLLNRGEVRLIVEFHRNGVVIASRFAGQSIRHAKSEIMLQPGSWYDIDVVVQNKEIIVIIDGNDVVRAAADPKLPDAGRLWLESGGHYSIDRLRIVIFSTLSH